MLQISLVVVTTLLGTAAAQVTDENKARQYIEGVFNLWAEYHTPLVEDKWNLDTANNDDKKQLQQIYGAGLEKRSQVSTGTYEEFKNYDWKAFTDPNLKRMFFLWSDYGDDLLPPNDKESLENTVNELKDRGNAKVNDFDSQDGSSQLDINQMKEEIYKDFANVEKLNYYWKEWLETAAKPLKEPFTRWIELKTKTAESNGYSSILEYWQGINEVEDYEATMFPLLDEIQPLFTELHAYLRHKLREIYGDDAISPTGPIPVSLTVWEWGDTPADLLNRLLPFPDKKKWDIAPQLQAKGIKGRTMVETMDRFFQSIGLEKLPEDFYSKSIFEEQENINCQGAAAYDFFKNDDYRVILCAEPTQASYDTVARMVGAVEWLRAESGLPVFNHISITSFEGAVSFALNTFTNSPKYLNSLELIEQDFQTDKDLEINLLFEKALIWVFNTPLGLAFDLWRWRVIKKEIQPENYNCEYWNLRTKYQGVEPPLKRDNTDFDPGFFTDISGEEMVTKVMTRFMYYDIIWSLCTTADEYHPNTTPENDLMFCDVRDNHEVGAKLNEAWKLGNTLPWNEVLGKITGRNRLDATGLNEFYKPLLEWLKKYNKDNNVPTGWPDHTDKCT